MLRTLSLVFALFGCSNFQEQGVGLEPSTGYVLISSSDVDLDSDLSILPSGESVEAVASIDELDLLVVDADVASDIQDTQVEIQPDTYHVFDAPDVLSNDSEILSVLSEYNGLVVQALGDAPEKLEFIAESHHEWSVLNATDSQLYTSEIIQILLASSEQGTEIFYLPLKAEIIDPLILETIRICTDRGMSVFDATGFEI